MSRPPSIDATAVVRLFQVRGPQSAQALAEALGVDRSTISRTLARLGEAVERLGTTHGARYALRREVRTWGGRFPLYRVDATGRPQAWAELTALHGGWRVAWATGVAAPAWADAVVGRTGFVEGFPFFLGDVRPQGYLGRLIGRALPPALGLDPDPRNWRTDDDTLVYLLAEGDDLPGDVIVGDGALRRFQAQRLAPAAALRDSERAVRYPELARGALPSGGAGSSVEGEQPKFLAVLTHDADEAGAEAVPVIVKFTDRLETPTGRRWADLLAAEAHALAVLHAHGEAAHSPRVLDAEGRRFFEVPRFDRVGRHGRRGVVSLRALHDAFDGPDTNEWTTAVAELVRRGLVDAATLQSVRRRAAFGRLIGNTDMHFGNLAFWFDDTLPLRVAPAYDQLPMGWAPQPGDATPRPVFQPALPLPAERDDWLVALGWAEDCWRRIAADAGVSPDFAAIARASLTTLARLRALA